MSDRWRALIEARRIRRLWAAFALAGTMAIAGIVGASPADAAPGNMIAPIPSGQSWYVYRGYNYASHTGTSKYGLDLTVGTSTTSSAGKTVVAPRAGTIRYWQSTYGNLCIDSSDGRSYTLTHIDATKTSGTVTAGESLGRIAPANTRMNGGVAHLHFEVWAGPGCYNQSDPIPLDGAHRARICGAPDMVANGPAGPNGVWSGTTFTAQSCGATAGIIASPDTGHAYYVDTSSRVANAWYTTKWNVAAIGGVVRPSSSIASPAMGTVFYVDTANRLAVAYHDSAGWHTGALGGAVRAGSGPVSPDTGHAYYVDTSSRVANAWYTTKWNVAAIGGVVRPSSSIASPAMGTVFYVDTANRLAVAYHDSAGWHTGALGGAVRAGSGPVSPDTGHAYYVDTSSRVANAWYTTKWNVAAIGGVVRPDSSIASPAMGTVFYVDTANRLAVAYHDSAGWHTATIGGAVRPGTGPVSPDTSHVFFVDTAGRIANAWKDSAGWHMAAIGGAVR